MRFRKEEGFTLVELMVVVLIIGILVAIAIPVFNAASGQARQRTCHSNMRTIEGAVDQYLAADPANTRGQCAGTNWVGLLVGANSYIKDNPQCPGDAATNDTDYSYAVATTQVTDTGDAAHPHY